MGRVGTMKTLAFMKTARIQRSVGALRGIAVRCLFNLFFLHTAYRSLRNYRLVSIGILLTEDLNLLDHAKQRLFPKYDVF